MILIVGGRASGKFDYIRELGYSELDIAQGILDQRPVLYGLQELVWQDPTGVEALLPQLLEKQVIACDEVGLGVIPLDAREREYREAVGRLCIKLAQKADQVLRLVCGIPQTLKG